MTDAASYMQDPERRQRRESVGEREMLERFLDFQRDTLLWKASGLTRDQLVAPHTPSGMSLLGIIKHMAYVEHNWFQGRFMGGTMMTPWVEDPDSDFRIEPDDTVQSVLDFFQREVEEARRIVAAADSLDTMAQSGNPPRSLRWIMIHMIEEVARHAGHADFMREFTDGQTGE